jgi:biopolymer transport protein ExbB
MIEIFGSQAPTGAGANPQLLAHGISVALYNTAFGLMIAIPSLMLYRYFRRRVDEFQLQMEMAAERMVPHLMRFAVRNPD